MYFFIEIGSVKASQDIFSRNSKYMLVCGNFRKKDRWMDELGFYVPSTVFQSFRDDGKVNIKALCNEAPLRFGKNLASSGFRTRDHVIRSRER